MSDEERTAVDAAVRSVPSDQFKVSGHTLRDEGAAFVGCGGQWTRRFAMGVYGTGRALCSCGATSAMLDSSRARRGWHRQHKIEVLAEMDREPEPPTAQEMRDFADRLIGPSSSVGEDLVVLEAAEALRLAADLIDTYDKQMEKIP